MEGCCAAKEEPFLMSSSAASAFHLSTQFNRAGESVCRAERRAQKPSTLTPDADHAAVGKARYTRSFFGGVPHGGAFVLLFRILKARRFVVGIRGLSAADKGERLMSRIQAMGSRVPA